jgi:hypothetical protein
MKLHPPLQSLYAYDTAYGQRVNGISGPSLYVRFGWPMISTWE